MSHASVLAPFVDEAVNFARGKGMTINVVAVSCGPGSYTGLRIGVSLAKGLCFGWEIPLIAVPTLQVLTMAVLRDPAFSDFLFCPMIDARRMEVYTALYDKKLRPVKGVSAEIIDRNSFLNELSERKIVFFGTGAEKCKAVIQHPNAIFLDDVYPLAKNMLPLSEEKFFRNDVENVAYFEPFYLKDFVATTPKKLIP